MLGFPRVRCVLGFLGMGLLSLPGAHGGDREMSGAFRPGLEGDAAVLRKSAPVMRMAQPLEIVLPPLADSKRLNPRESGGALLIGHGRSMPDAFSGDISGQLNWHRQVGLDGLAASVRLNSRNAQALRVGVRLLASPDVQVRFTSPNGSDLGLPAMHAKAKGEALGKAKMIWSPTVFGEGVGIHVVAPTRADADSVRIELVGASHIFDVEEMRSDAGSRSSQCRIPVACEVDRSSTERESVFRMSFVDSDGNSIACTGTLLNDRRSEEERFAQPYLYTANHCIATQAVAETLELVGRYEQRTCADAQQSDDFFYVRGGADLLETSAYHDQTLLRMKSFPPGVRIWLSGWRASGNPPAVEDAIGIHHPGGGWKSWARGRVRAGHSTVNVGGHGEVQGAGVDYLEGGTESGSSGSALFIDRGDEPRAMGALSAGPKDDCTSGYYGWMGDFWNRIEPWMTDSPPAPTDDHGNSRGTATSVLLNSSVPGRLSTSDDVDWFTFTVEQEGDAVLLSRGGVDAYGRLYAADGRLLGESDDDGEALNFRLEADLAPGVYYLQVSGWGGDLGDYEVSVQFTPHPVHSRSIPLVLSASEKADSGWQSFIRVQNYEDSAQRLRFTGVDDSGTRHGPVFVTLDGWESRHFNSGDLEHGNTAKGLSGGLGTGVGWWRLQIRARSPVFASGYVRTNEGFLTGVHDVGIFIGADEAGRFNRLVPTFNPASNFNQVSVLRVSNLSHDGVMVRVGGLDDLGVWGDEPFDFLAEASESYYFSAKDLEEGIEYSDGSMWPGFGDGTGKWQLLVASDGLIRIQSLMFTKTGHLSNLSGINLLEPDAADLRSMVKRAEWPNLGYGVRAGAEGAKRLPKFMNLPPTKR